MSSRPERRPLGRSASWPRLPERRRHPIGCPVCRGRSAFTVLSETGTIAAEAWDANGRHVNLIGPPTTTYRCQYGHIWTEEGRRQIRQRGGVDPTGVVVAGAPVVSNEHLLRAVSLPIVSSRPVSTADVPRLLNAIGSQLRRGLQRLIQFVFDRQP